MERVFLKQGLDNNKKAFTGFYLTLKAHKLKPGQNVKHLKSRPIIACPGSLLHPLGIWIDQKLQTIAKQQESYFRNSFKLRQQLCSTAYPPNTKLFTADAVSMYSNIPTNTAIMLIAKHIRKSVTEERPKQNEALIASLKLAMLNNIFSFGDMTFKQLNGTAMGNHQPHHTLPFIMDFMKNTSYQNIKTTSYSISGLLTMYSASGYPTPIPKPTPVCGKNSRIP